MKSSYQLILTLILTGTLTGRICLGNQATPEAKSAVTSATPAPTAAATPAATSAGSPAAASTTTTEATSEVEPKVRPMSESQVSAEVAKALPKWDASILSARDGAKWSAKVGFAEVLKAVGDSPLKDLAPKNKRRVVDGERVLRLIPEHGTVRYVNRALSWNADKSGKLVENEVALRTANNALTTLGLPSTELGKPRVDTQGARDASNTAPTDTKTYEMYRLVTVNRQMGNLPVLGSRARVAIADSGGIQRLRVNWPPFTMPRGLKVRQQDAVTKEVVKRIMQQDPVSLVGVAGSDLSKFVSAKLAYAPHEMTKPDRTKPSGKDTEKRVDEAGPPDADDKQKDSPVQFGSDRKVYPTVLYVPVVLVTVAASPTPYQIVVPLAEGG